MAELPRLNGIIRALEQGQPTFTTFTQAEVARRISLGNEARELFRHRLACEVLRRRQ